MKPVQNQILSIEAFKKEETIRFAPSHPGETLLPNSKSECPSTEADLKERVRAWWDGRPCGSLISRQPAGSQPYFEEIERHRYEQEPHIPNVVRFEAWREKEVLEIGCGLGTDMLQFARAGARVTGIDLTPRAIELAAARFRLYNLDGNFEPGDAEHLRFPSGTFDLVYSNGVLHHTPDIESAVAETYRVLKPGGTAILMLYHKHSYNYLINILLFRRLAFALLRQGCPPQFLSRISGVPIHLIRTYQETLQKQPRWTTQDLLNNNTDGPGNPWSRVYSRRDAKKLFRRFHPVHTEVHWLVKKNIPMIGNYVPRSVDYLFGRLAGWALYIIAVKPRPFR
jgi:ubiquinone/menaquinone biosynthesis C-methylase UbiE